MNLFFRIAFFSVTLCLLISFPGSGQNTGTLSKADSLYNANKFTEAFQLYHEVYAQGYASPAMLIKMAYIKEGLGDYTQALYFLNHYYKQTNNKRAFSKMQELAEKYELQGYEYSDGKFLTGILQQYKYLIIMCLSGFVLILGGYIFRSRRKKESPYFPAALQFIIVVLIFILANNFLVPTQGIIIRSNNVAMSGPSAGAEPVEIIEKGHKIVVLDKQEIWSKIRWGDQEVYIRSNSFNDI